MSVYIEAQQAKNSLSKLIETQIAQNKSVKAAIKARKAKVTTAASDTATAGYVGVKLIGDKVELILPYNPVFEASDLTVGTVVSVWYNYNINNGIVMQDAAWQKAGSSSGTTGGVTKTTATATLTVSGWGTDYTQTVSVSGVTGNNDVFPSPNASDGTSYDVWSEAGVRCTGQASGQLTFSCKTIPTVNISVNIVIFS